MEASANFRLLRPRFFRQVQFCLAGTSFRYRNFFVLPGQPTKDMDFMSEIPSLDSDHSCFDRRWGSAVPNFAPFFVFPPRHGSSYAITPSDVGWAPKHVIRPSGSWVYFWRHHRDNFLCALVVDCCRWIFSIGHLVCASVKR